MTLRIPSADVSLLDSYDRSLTSEGPELTRRPTFDGDIPPVEDTNAGLTEELPVPGTKQERREGRVASRALGQSCRLAKDRALLTC